MRFILFQRGATSWGFQTGRLWFYWPYLKFWASGSRPTWGWENDR